MVLWQLTAVALLAAIAAATGWRLGHTRWWPLGYLLPLLAVGLVILGRRSVTASFVAPVEWATRTAVAYLLMAAAIPLLLATLMPRLRARRQRIALAVLMAAMLTYYSLLPTLLPWWARSSLASLPTRLTPDGVCLQSAEYTCGPAAAVTALERLGIHAQEGPLGIAARTAPAEGTDPRDLAAAIEQLYAPQGARAAYRRFLSLDDLAQSTPVIVSVSSNLLTHHYITVLQVRDDTVLVGDPLRGLVPLRRREFAAIWPAAGIQVWRTPP